MQLINRLIRNLARWRRVQETATELQALDDRTLTDLGIIRADIRRVAEHSVAANTPKDTARTGDFEAYSAGVGYQAG